MFSPKTKFSTKTAENNSETASLNFETFSFFMKMRWVLFDVYKIRKIFKIIKINKIKNIKFNNYKRKFTKEKKRWEDNI